MTVERHTYVLRKYRFIIGLSISRNDRMSSVLMEDITSAEFSTGVICGPVDYITAIGVMFHIVDDERWKRAVQNLAAVLKPDGVMFIGGDFGPETRNVQFHRKDEFKDWREHGTAEVPKDEVRINKRVGSVLICLGGSKFVELPDVICETCFHCWRHAQGLMNAPKIIEGKV